MNGFRSTDDEAGRRVRARVAALVPLSLCPQISREGIDDGTASCFTKNTFFNT